MAGAIFIIVWLLACGFVGQVAKEKGRSPWGFAFYALLLLPLALLHVMIVSAKPSSMKPMQYIGKNGEIMLGDEGLVISRSRLYQGLGGQKSIPYASITAVHFKDAELFSEGFVQLSVLGGIESKGGRLAARYDENTLAFRLNNKARFAELRREIEQRMALSRGRRPATPAAEPPVPAREDRKDQPSVAAEIERLAALLQSGRLSEEEFQIAKRKAIGI